MHICVCLTRDENVVCFGSTTSSLLHSKEVLKGGIKREENGIWGKDPNLFSICSG